MSEENGSVFMDKPFVSHDGKDQDGVRAEVIVRKGAAIVDQKSEMDKMIKYHFSADNLQKYNGFSASASKADVKIVKILESALESGDPIRVRTESVRNEKKVSDRTIPMKDVGNGDRFSRVAAVMDEDGNWIYSENGMALTNPAEDPNVHKSALDMDPSELSNAKVSNGGEPRRFHPIESSPWSDTNVDGAPNPGGPSAQAAVSVYFFAMENMENKSDNETIRKVADEILLGADMLQVGIYKMSEREEKIEDAERSLNSHTRSRHIIFELIKNLHAIDDEAIKSIEEKPKANAPSAWMKEILTESKKIFFWSMGYDEKGHMN